MKKRIQFLILTAVVFCCTITATQSSNAANKKPQLVIFETDMGNDVDDALALDLLYKYMDQGKVKVLAVMCNKPGEASARFVDIMNTWYGYPKIPIGIVRNGAKCDDAVNYAQVVSEMKKDGKPLYKTTVKDVTKLPDAHTLYRKILAKQADQSVIIISVGFSTNLARLLDTQADSYSKLTGKELIAKKVKYMSLMAGNIQNEKYGEYNVIRDIPACKKLFAESPVPIVTSPFELGKAIYYPGSSIEQDFTWASNHPMVDAYKSYLKMPYNRPTWDLTAVLQVLEPNQYMTQSPAGNIVVDEKGCTHYTQKANGLHSYLTVTKEQAEGVKQFFLRVIPQKPKNKK